jgi:hypothetical protein
MTIRTREKRLALAMQWFGKNPNVAHYFTAKIPNVIKKIEYAIIKGDNLYSVFIGYAAQFVPRKYVAHIIERELRQWLCNNGSY